MDQLTHTVRRSNWINIIRQCQDRPAGTTAKQWLAENDISEKSYYYWLRKIRREVCEQEELQKVTEKIMTEFLDLNLCPINKRQGIVIDGEGSKVICKD